MTVFWSLHLCLISIFVVVPFVFPCYFCFVVFLFPFFSISVLLLTPSFFSVRSPACLYQEDVPEGLGLSGC